MEICPRLASLKTALINISIVQLWTPSCPGIKTGFCYPNPLAFRSFGGAVIGTAACANDMMRRQPTSHIPTFLQRLHDLVIVLRH